MNDERSSGSEYSLGERATLCTCVTSGNFREHFTESQDGLTCDYCAHYVRSIVIQEKHIQNHKKLIEFMSDERFRWRKLEVMADRLRLEEINGGLNE